MEKASRLISTKAAGVIFGSILGAFLLSLASTPTSALVPYQMNFQGRLNDSTGAPMPNGTYNMTFRIYSSSTGGSPLWSEVHANSSSTGVSITTGGLFSVQLGSVTSLPNNIWNTSTPLYLEIELPTPATATTNSPSYTEGPMGPRNPIASSAYAFNSQMLNGQDATYYLNAGNLTGTVNPSRISGSYTGITGTGALTVGSIASGFGTISTTNTITTTSTIQGSRLISTIATGTAPLTVASTTLVTNLNADLLDGHDTSYFQPAGSYLTDESDTLSSVTGRGATTSTSVSLTGGATIQGLTVNTATATQDQIIIQAAATGSARFNGTITNADLTAARTYTLPDTTGILITTGNLTNITSVGTITAGTWNGGTIAVARGGTGATTLASGGILYGNGTSAIQATAVLANGQLLIGDGSGAPTIATLTAGSGISISNGAGSITIEADSTVCRTSSGCAATGSAGGDLTGSYPSPTIAKLQNSTLTLSSIATGQVLIYNGTAWVNTSNPTIAGNLIVQGTGASSFAGSLTVTGATTLSSTLAVTGTITSSSTIQGTRLISTIATGTAPLAVTSTTLVTNLNADLLDGQQGSYYQNASNLNAGTVANARLTGSGSLTITAGTGLTGGGAVALGGSSTIALDTTYLNANYAPTSGSSNYIQNGTSPQTAGFNVTGSGVIGGGLSVSGNTGVYTISTPTYNLTSFSGTSVSLTDDQMSGAITLPFTFNFYGTNYNTVYICSNGFITFKSGQSCPYQVQTLPNGSSPQAAIYGIQRDLFPNSGGTITYGTVGTSPNQIFIVYFNNVPANGLPVTFQIKLNQADNSVEIHTATSGNYTSTQGIQNETGTIAAVPTGRNNSLLNITNDAVRFISSSLSVSGGVVASSFTQNGYAVCDTSNNCGSSSVDTDGFIQNTTSPQDADFNITGGGVIRGQLTVGNTYDVGNTGPGGGTIFYVDNTTIPATYYEAAPSNWNGGSSDPILAWCSSGSSSSTNIGTLTGIGTGKANTALIASNCTGTGATSSIASYSGGGKTDWFLPSKDELNELYQQKDLVSGFTADVYWSSSEIGTTTAQNQSFVNGSQSNFGKTAGAYVRPVRSFQITPTVTSIQNGDIITTGQVQMAGGLVIGDSDSVFHVQDTGGNSVFNVDSTNKQVSIGQSATYGGISFDSSVSYGVGYTPSSVTTDDFNGDGKPDLAVSSATYNTVSILLNKGDGTFAPGVNYTTGTNPQYVTTADFNGDGKPDIAVANYSSNTVSILMNNGNGTFATKVDYTTGTSPQSVTTADFNGDGKPDLAVTNNGSNTVSILMNNGNGTFATKVDYTTGTQPFSAVAGDFNGDGKPDLAVTNNYNGTGGNTVSVLMNNGTGTFATKVDYTTGTSPQSVTTADFNGDGKPDLVVANYYSLSVSVLMNNGGGSFATKVDYTTGSNPRSVTTADFNGDGRPDIVVTDYSNTVSVLTNTVSGTFANKVSYATGASPYSVTTADFNGDGKPDIATTDTGGSGVVTVLLNKGGTFATRMDYTTGVSPQSVTTADFNGDGKPDLAVANFSDNTISIFLNNGNGTFATRVSYATGTHPYYVTAADFNGDGKPDLVVINRDSNTVSVLMNNGTGTFSAKVDYTTGSSPQSVTTGDFNGDGKPDFAVANGDSNTVSVLMNNGTGTFAAKVDYTTGSSPYSVTAADFNGDGHLDLATANYSSDTVSVLVNNGTGTFAAKVDYATTTGDHLFSITAADFNGDGKPDLATSGTSTVSVLMNNGDGTFGSRSNYVNAGYIYMYSVTSADFNGDGRLDIVATEVNLSAALVLINNGDGTFTPGSSYNAGNSPQSVTTADFNGDGKPDLAVANTIPGSGSISIVFNHSTPTTGGTLSVTTATPSTAGIIVQSSPDQVADLIHIQNDVGKQLMVVDADGNVTIGSAQPKHTQSISSAVAFGTAPGIFTSKTDYTTGTSPASVTSADVNSDGYLDIIETNQSSNTVSVFLNNGNGTFASKVDYTTATSPRSVTTGDFNGDGKLDLAVADSGSAKVSVFLNNGNGTFATKVDYTTGSNPYSVTVADFNGDGKPDLAVANYISSGTVSVLLNNGNGTFATKVDYAAGSYPYSITTADFNSDGKYDLAVANYSSNTVSVLMGNGNGTFATKVDYTTGSAPQSVTAGDFNGDNKPDLAVANAGSSTVSVLMNNGNGTFAAKVDYTTGTNPYSVTTADLNGDGKLDLAVANSSSSTVSIFMNNSIGIFATKVDYNTGTNPWSVTAADFNADGKPDLAVANYSLNTVSVLLNNSSIFNNDKVDYTVGTNAYAYSTADFNGDGKLDIAVVNNGSNTLSVLLGSGSGSFSNRVDYALGSNSQSIATADLNGDGKPDLIVGNFNAAGTVSVFLNNGNGTFAGRVDYTTGNNPQSIAAADFNGDGKIDLATANRNSNTISILIGNGNGTFAAKVDYTTGAGPISVVAADFNGDGKPDLAVNNNSSNTVSVLRNNGNGTFATKVDYTVGGNSQSVTAADFNGDGKPDLAVTNDTEGTVSILMNNGSGAFAAKVDYASGTNSRSATAADFNGDGKIDLAVANWGSKTTTILINNGSGVFNSIMYYSNGLANPWFIGSADLNGDNYPDIILLNWNSSLVSVILNTTLSKPPMTYTSALSVTTSSSSTGGLIIQGSNYQLADLLNIQDASGSGLFTIDATGSVRAKGTITGGVGSPDYAENITVANNSIAAADVVAIAPDGSGTAVLANEPYSSRLLGVISTNPGFITNASGVDQASARDQRPLALSGRVPVKVSDINGPIVVGDYLTASTIPGVAMKATDSGAVIGVAMESFDGTSGQTTTCGDDNAYNCGKVLLFINPSAVNPNSLNLQGANPIFSTLAINGSITTADINVGGLATVANLQVTGDAAITGNLTVQGITHLASIYVNGSIISTGDTPTITPSDNLGTNATATIDGTDSAGTVELRSGDDTPVGDNNDRILATIKFTKVFNDIPRIVISANNDSALSSSIRVEKTIDSNGKYTGFNLISSKNTANLQASFDYIVIMTGN